jgi:lactate dehydrogenase-like 2-hydroxyacid dehydrogenase
MTRNDFQKIILYDFERDSLDQEFLNELNRFAESVEVIKTSEDYSEELKNKEFQEADALVTRVFDNYPMRRIIESNIEYIGMMATDISDFSKLNDCQIELKATETYARESVAELTIAALFNLSLRLEETANFVDEGGWDVGPFPGKELKDKTIGVIGLGKIGSRVAEIADCIGMNVIYNSRTEKDVKYTYKPLKNLVESSDVLSIHTDLNPSSKNLLDKKILNDVKDKCIILNPSRTEITDMDKIKEMARKKKIKIWMDAVEDEEAREKLSSMDNVLLTSHSGCATEEARERLKQETLENIQDYLRSR